MYVLTEEENGYMLATHLLSKRGGKQRQETSTELVCGERAGLADHTEEKFVQQAIDRAQRIWSKLHRPDFRQNDIGGMSRDVGGRWEILDEDIAGKDKCTV